MYRGTNVKGGLSSMRGSVDVEVNVLSVAGQVECRWQ